ncbi:MAG: cation:proton antiporter [Tissierellia bacterium]|nr:cation:proton antiporter [Tissierellia bacterium]
MEYLYSISVLLLSGLLFSRLLSRIKFPDVTGYLIAGIIIGPSVAKILSWDSVHNLEIISEVALSFIAFSIGSEMNLKTMQKIGPKILLVTIFEALGAFFFVTLSCVIFFKESWPFALVLGSIACATAPAATLMVIRQYKAKGDLVDILVPVVAMDDAIGIMTFGIASSIATSLLQGGDFHLVNMIFHPIKEIFLSFAIGAVMGYLYSVINRKLRNDDEVLAFTIAFVFLTAAGALYLKLSSLLTLMVMGLVISNLGAVNRRYQTLMEKVTPPIFICFFVLSGADLDLKSIASVGMLGICYIITRVVGKYLGAFSSSKIVGFSKEVQHNLGWTLVPQAGVAIGLSLLATKMIPTPHGEDIRTIILGATIVYELVGPLTAKWALRRSGCIDIS